MYKLCIWTNGKPFMFSFAARDAAVAACKWYLESGAVRAHVFEDSDFIAYDPTPKTVRKGVDSRNIRE